MTTAGTSDLVCASSFASGTDAALKTDVRRSGQLVRLLRC